MRSALPDPQRTDKAVGLSGEPWHLAELTQLGEAAPFFMIPHDLVAMSFERRQRVQLLGRSRIDVDRIAHRFARAAVGRSASAPQ